MSAPLKNVSGIVEMNAAGAEQLSNELASFSASGKPCRIAYSRDLGRVMAMPVTSEKSITFLTKTADGSPRNRAWISIKCFAREVRDAVV
jgi:hypothetical protein